MDSLIRDVAAKVDEQIERTIHLIDLIPSGTLKWAPPIPGAWPIAELLGHLLDCMAGLCAVLYSAYPQELAHLADLQKLPVNFACTPAQARQRIELYKVHIDQGFAALRDADLERKLPTVFVAEGESILTLLLGNLEHIINHKHQLFTYLKLLPVDVGTPDLYSFRGAALL